MTLLHNIAFTPLVLPLILFVAAPVAAQDSAAAPAQPTLLAQEARQTMLWDEADDGSWWARARCYKLQITDAAVTYAPALGASAPHNFPLTLRPVECRVGDRSLSLGPTHRERSADTVTLQRGALREVWRLGLDTAEQDFVVDAAGENAAIVVRMAVETACGTPIENADGSLYFPAETFGGIRYGHAVIVDGAGHRLVQPSRFRDGCIELCVPAAFVRDAVGPITIDPVIQTISIDTSPLTQELADVAFVSGPDVWLAVYEEINSASDHDIISRRFTRAGVFLEEVPVEITFSNTLACSVAGNRARSQFLIAWRRDVAADSIDCRVRTAGTTTQAPAFTIVSSLLDTFTHPDVGGSLSATGADFCVLWERNDHGTHRIEYATVTAGIGGPVQIIAPLGFEPSISKTCGAGQAWLVAYRDSSAVSNTVLCQIINHLGNLVDTARSVGQATTFSVTDVAGDGFDFLVVWSRDVSSSSTIIGRRVRLTGAPVMVGNEVDLIVAQAGTNPALPQERPRVAGGGCRYVFSYEEDAQGAGNREIFAATMVFGTAPIFIDNRVSLSTVPGQVHTGGIAMTTDTGDPASPLALATFSSVNVFGSLIDVLDPTGGITVVQTGCGGILFEPSFTAVGAPGLGRSVVLNLGNLTPSSLPFIVLGLSSTPITLCTNGCQQGVNPILASVFGTTHTFNIPCIASLLHISFAAQGITIVTSGLQGACPSTLFGTPFRVSDTLRLRLQ